MESLSRILASLRGRRFQKEFGILEEEVCCKWIPQKDVGIPQKEMSFAWDFNPKVSNQVNTTIC